MTRPHIVVLLSCGFGVRNYLRGGSIERLAENAAVTVMVPPGDDHIEGELRDRGCGVAHLDDLSPGRALSMLDFVVVTAENMRHDVWRPSFWRWCVGLERPSKRPLLHGLRWTAAIARRNLMFRAAVSMRASCFAALPAVARAGETLARLRADLVFSTNPYRPNQVAPALAAAARGIPAAAAIMSWDNLSYKGMPVPAFSRYLVWSELMAAEVLRADTVSRADIAVTGTPQFDFHVDEKLRWSRTEFERAVGAAPGRRLITYSGSTPQALPEEPELVALLADAARCGDLRDNPQILVRLHPHDGGDRFVQLRGRYPELLLSRPWPSDPRHGTWFTPSMRDLALLSNTLRYSDVVVNAFSTTALDALVAGRPSVCAAFSTQPETAAARYLSDSPTFGHCRYLADTRGVRIARDAAELVGLTQRALDNPDDDRAEREVAVRRICGTVDGHASERISNVLLRIAGSDAHLGVSHLPSAVGT